MRTLGAGFFGSRDSGERKEAILTVIRSAARHTLELSAGAELLDVLPKLTARTLDPPPTNDDLDELRPRRWKRAHHEVVLKFREDERRQVDDCKKDRRER